MKRWTIAHEAIFCCGVACCSVVTVVVFVVGLPVVVLVPGLWRGYTCWPEDEEHHE